MSAIVEFRGVGYAVPRPPETAKISQGAAILDRLDFTVDAGETLVLLGRSGSGKTTALKMVNRLLAPTSGEVLVEGQATGAWDPIRLRRRIGYVIQETGLFPHFTVAENIGLVPKLEGWDAARIRARVHELLERVDLPPGEFAARYPRELSGGQRQRVGVARALAADPPVLLFDEPFGALDPVTRLDLQRQFLALRKTMHKTAIFVTHDVREALMLASRIGLMRAGRLEMLVAPEQFLAMRTEAGARTEGVVRTEEVVRTEIAARTEEAARTEVAAATREARAFLACLDWKMETGKEGHGQRPGQ